MQSSNLLLKIIVTYILKQDVILKTGLDLIQNIIMYFKINYLIISMMIDEIKNDEK